MFGHLFEFVEASQTFILFALTLKFPLTLVYLYNFCQSKKMNRFQTMTHERI